MKRILATIVLATSSITAMAANNLDSLQFLGQSDFRLLSEDLGSALSYKALAPAEPLGITGIDVGVEVTATSLQHSNLFDRACSGCGLSTMPLAKLHFDKGLPFNFDIGGFYSAVPNSNIKLMGAELRYALIAGGIAMPAVAIRGTYTKLGGVDQLDFSTRGLELTTSKGFAMFTPYAGIGRIWSTSNPNLPAPYTLSQESFSQNKVFIGGNLNLGLVNFALEGDKTGDATSYGLKMGFRW